MAVAPQSLAQSLASGASAGGGVVTLQYHSGQDVTILVSKGGSRYRLQSDCFEAIWLVLHVSGAIQGASSLPTFV